MSILWLIVFSLLIGLAIYRMFYTLVESVRFVMALASMVTFIIIVQNLETIDHLWNSAGAWPVQFFSNNRTRHVLIPSERTDPVTDFAFQSFIRKDQNFLDELTQAQSQITSLLARPKLQAHKSTRSPPGRLLEQDKQ